MQSREILPLVQYVTRLQTVIIFYKGELLFRDVRTHGITQFRLYRRFTPITRVQIPSGTPKFFTSICEEEIVVDDSATTLPAVEATFHIARVVFHPEVKARPQSVS